MKKILISLCLLFIITLVKAQSPVGKWKITSHISEFGGQKFDSHKALLTQRPCASAIVYEINSDNTFRLNAKAANCDIPYKKIQEKLYSKTNWKMVGNKIIISSIKDFSVGQTYTLIIKGNTMIWIGTDGQGTITYQKI